MDDRGTVLDFRNRDRKAGSIVSLADWPTLRDSRSMPSGKVTVSDRTSLSPNIHVRRSIGSEREGRLTCSDDSRLQ
jgi:hypothetical protein